ncbi:hypothetical protein PoB_007591800 [Plakobranchus ocellatus]|uniref:Uncharacterized protein n=1 Tax=Plakobranchus ocellatus TaxID=259542 RepID=A0AAV4DYQ3_9GAST|nr:hypothetical protein PoB_007591800 [Plakobranchus ocellatus]
MTGYSRACSITQRHSPSTRPTLAQQESPSPELRALSCRECDGMLVSPAAPERRESSTSGSLGLLLTHPSPTPALLRTPLHTHTPTLHGHAHAHEIIYSPFSDAAVVTHFLNIVTSWRHH